MSVITTRDFVIDFLKREVVGPDAGYPATQLNGEEIILDSPKNRYGAGILFPKKSVQLVQVIGSETDQKVAEDASNDSAEDQPPLQDTEKFADPPDEVEQEVALTNEYLPSAMGLSTLIEVPSELLIEIRTARYVKGPPISVSSGTYTKKDKKGIAYCDYPKNFEAVLREKSSWCRVPICATVRITQQELLKKDVEAFWKEVVVDDFKENLALHVVTRPADLGGNQPTRRLITLTLVNMNESQNNTTRDEDCFFQTSFHVSASEQSPCFVPYPDNTFDENDAEIRSLYLLYRHKSVFAVGHGCASNWVEGTENRAISIQTDILPTYDIKPVRPRTIADLSLCMRKLAFEDDAKVLKNCIQLADEYSSWITLEETKAKTDQTLTKALRETAEKHIESCKKCCERMADGIKILSEDPKAMRAFRLMNESMFKQRAHYSLSSKNRRMWINQDGKTVLEAEFNKPDYSKLTAAWYPFQLGFILMNIRGITDPLNRERELVDLIWFPTGGGKTEAYLGLTAFVLFHRRLRGDDSASTAVLMRYTLRLLTTQQFQRAASLICACELLRKENKDLGKTPFSIGLWVGGDVTPNKGADAVKALNALLRGGDNKFIVTSCPWCGCQMGPIFTGNRKSVKGYVAPTKTKVFLRCEDSACPFSTDKLPVSVIDEDLYENPPSLLVGTVDKFAMLPWRPDSGAFFGWKRSGLIPAPDLVIQDELHLISGPLGSVVGLYEPLIDLLSTREKVGAKIIASTATISRADEQVKALYGRESALFPPQALVAGESFFAFEDSTVNGRTYAGVFGSGYSSHATSQVRSMSALLQSVKLASDNPALVDPYWTLIGYFNSLRELGHAVTLVGADIAEYIMVICERRGISKRGDDANFKLIRRIQNEEELTSRVNSTELPEKLNKLFIEYDGNPKCHAIDVCFATNMIQVGLDVSRLSLMTIVGQPKTTSEYIQASSRVGRESNKPGLVVVNYSPSKPRDRSHYERFRQYHQSIYRNVEPTSVTPFAVPVRDRALHALVIALVRLWGSSLLRNSPSGTPDSRLIDRITKAIVDRVAKAEPGEAAGTKEMIDQIFDKWKMLPASRYGDFGNMEAEPIPLMYQPGARVYLAWEERSYETPNNMRSVDRDCEGAMIPSTYPSNRQGDLNG